MKANTYPYEYPMKSVPNRQFYTYYIHNLKHQRLGSKTTYPLIKKILDYFYSVV